MPPPEHIRRTELEKPKQPLKAYTHRFQGPAFSYLSFNPQVGARSDGPHRAGARPPDAQRLFLFGDLLGLKGVTRGRSDRTAMVQLCRAKRATAGDGVFEVPAARGGTLSCSSIRLLNRCLGQRPTSSVEGGSDVNLSISSPWSVCPFACALCAKIRHFGEIRRNSQVPYEDMIFFDDWDQNCKDVGKLGVTCVECRRVRAESRGRRSSRGKNGLRG